MLCSAEFETRGVMTHEWCSDVCHSLKLKNRLIGHTTTNCILSVPLRNEKIQAHHSKAHVRHPLGIRSSPKL